MKRQPHDDLSNLSMLELFRVESENQTALLTEGLLALERAPASPKQLESLMRAAHSLKGAARIVNLTTAVRVAHGMEDCFVAAQRGSIVLDRARVDTLLRGVDLLSQIAGRDESNIAAWENEHAQEVETFLREVSSVQSAAAETKPTPTRATPIESPAPSAPPAPVVPNEQLTPAETAAVERVVRLNAENLNRLLGLAGESLVESRWMRPFSESLQRLKRMQSEVERSLDSIKQSLAQPVTIGGESGEPRAISLNDSALGTQLSELSERIVEARDFLADRLQELDLYDRRSAHLSNRLYLEVLRTRMRPFGDGTGRFPRMVRDLARSLGKQVRLEILGQNTQVDRDILERLETPLAHLLRNAVDHGCETPEERTRAGKPAEAVIQLQARHSAGMLLVTVSDDGAGIDLTRVRNQIVSRELTTPALAQRMSQAELLEFLFLPGFTVKQSVTELSGRGVGLDVVQNMVKAVRGTVRVSTETGRGARFQLQLPLTLSVLRTLLVDVAGEPYAIPLSQIAQVLRLSREQVERVEGRHFFRLPQGVTGRAGVIQSAPSGNHKSALTNGSRSSAVATTNYDSRTEDSGCVGLVWASQVLGSTGDSANKSHDVLNVVVLGDRGWLYGLVVDGFLGERELVVQPLDARLGKVKDISAAALMEDGSPVLILDVEDLVRSIEKLIAAGSLVGVPNASQLPHEKRRKRILAVDDSLTVRELERKLLSARGYVTEVAHDGMEAWNAVRTGSFDLVITDVDMPRMDGIELARLIKADAQLRSLPVMIVSYKDREEDRLRGLEAGADYYLTKGSFHDETLLQAVLDLIGEPDGD